MKAKTPQIQNGELFVLTTSSEGKSYWPTIAAVRALSDQGVSPYSPDYPNRLVAQIRKIQGP